MEYKNVGEIVVRVTCGQLAHLTSEFHALISNKGSLFGPLLFQDFIVKYISVKVHLMTQKKNCFRNYIALVFLKCFMDICLASTDPKYYVLSKIAFLYLIPMLS